MTTSTSDILPKSRLMRDISAMGIARGDHLGLGMSFKSIGPIAGGPDMFLDALLEVIGPQGTIMVNTFTPVFGFSKLATGRADQVFDHRSTPAATGIIAETLRRRPGAVRSRHPTDSVAAVGRLARYLTSGHDCSSRAFAPNSRLAHAGGKVLSIGVGDIFPGFVHEAQQLAGLLDVVPWKLGARFVDEQGAAAIFVAKDTPGCDRRLRRLVPLLRHVGVVRDGYVGRARSMMAPAKESLHLMTEILKKNPTLNLCDDVSCLWCRELERRLDLYADIENRHWFQGNPLAIALVATTNWFRLGGNPLVIKLRQLANTLGPRANPFGRQDKNFTNPAHRPGMQNDC